MHYFVVDVILPLIWAPVAHDQGGIVISVHNRHELQGDAELEIERLVEFDESQAAINRSFPLRNIRRVMVEARNTQNARRQSETIALDLVGQPIPKRWFYFGIFMHSVDYNSFEFAVKHSEVVTGPHSTKRAIMSALSDSAADVTPRLGSGINESLVVKDWPGAIGSSSRTCIIRAGDAAQALNGRGFLV